MDAKMEGLGKSTRIDFLKVKQKIFNSYPENSIYRKVILKEEKIRELQKLTMTRAIFSKDFTDSILELSKHNAFKFAFKTTLFFGFTFLAGLFGIIVSTSLFDYCIFFGTTFMLAFSTGRYLALAIGEFLGYTHMAIQQKDLEEKIQKLQSEIDKL